MNAVNDNFSNTLLVLSGVNCTVAIGSTQSFIRSVFQFG
jgi:hypothetical protein